MSLRAIDSVSRRQRTDRTARLIACHLLLMASCVACQRQYLPEEDPTLPWSQERYDAVLDGVKRGFTDGQEICVETWTTGAEPQLLHRVKWKYADGQPCAEVSFDGREPKEVERWRVRREYTGGEVHLRAKLPWRTETETASREKHQLISEVPEVIGNPVREMQRSLEWFVRVVADPSREAGARSGRIVLVVGGESFRLPITLPDVKPDAPSGMPLPVAYTGLPESLAYVYMRYIPGICMGPVSADEWLLNCYRLARKSLGEDIPPPPHERDLRRAGQE